MNGNHLQYTSRRCADGSTCHHIRNKTGAGSLKLYQLCDDFLISIVNLHLGNCPYLTDFNLIGDDWILVNYCTSGRCEVTLPGNQTAIVKPGDCSLSGCAAVPDEYLYPLNLYTGVELFIRPSLTARPAYTLLAEAGLDLAAWLPDLNREPVVYEKNELLSALLQKISAHAGDSEPAHCHLLLMELLLAFREIGIRPQGSVVYYSKLQLGIAKKVHALLTTDLSRTYNLRSIARDHGISVGTLNNYFRALYGDSIPAYMREERMTRAADLLTTTRIPVYEIAAMVGYANASKFGSAFAGRYGAPPSSFRRGGTRLNIPAAGGQGERDVPGG